ncbi:MAG TPA: ADOP family duplicated permease [Longimicrobiales bacterium]|nr:ADOP family duplicated permease [Longimicrobiales bacterium]
MRGPPPRVLEWILGRVLHASSRESVLGDLHEEYVRIEGDRGRSAALMWYAGQALASLRPSVRRRFSRGFPRVARTRRGMVVDSLLMGVMQAWRSLWRRPAYTVAAVTTLALAIGANAATFGVVDAILLRPLSYPDAERIVSLGETHPARQSDWGWLSIPNLADWRAEAASFEAAALFRGGSMAVTGDGDPEYVVGMRVEPAFFEVFGTAAHVGRTVSGSEAGDESYSTVVLSHGLWTRRHGGSPDIVGTMLILDGSAHTIVGVMPRGFNAGGDWIGAPVDVWVPVDFAAMGESRSDRSYNAAARLRPGATVSDARAELSLIASRLSAIHPDENDGWSSGVMPWKELIVGDTRSTLLLVWAAMALVLLAACANVGNLVLNRALARESDAAVRRALGARSGRLVGGVLLESVLLALAGAALGFLLAFALLSAVRALDPGDLPRLATAAVDVRGAGFTVLVAVAVGVSLGLYPAWRASRAGVQDTLRSARSGASRNARRVRDGMTVVQLAIAVALLAGSALAMHGFLRLRSVPPGFQSADVLTATVVLSWNRVPERADRAAFTRAVLDRLRALPGVESAAMINSLPFSGSSMQQTFLVAGRPASPQDEPFAGIRGISPDYARTMRIPVRGRELRDADLVVNPSAVLVNETLANRYFAGRDPLGERIVLFGGEVEAEIIGVIGDVHHFSLDRAAVPEIYVPYTADFLSSKTFLVRSGRDPASLGDAVRTAIHDVDADQPLRARGPERAETVPLNRIVSDSLGGQRFRTLVLTLLAGLAVVLSVVGLSAVIAITVTERTREIGLRMALGADRRAVLRWMLRRTAGLTTIGLIAGMAIVLAGGRALEAMLFDLTARDPGTLLLGAAAFLLIAAPAVLAPSLRATRIDPGRVLRDE